MIQIKINHANTTVERSAEKEACCLSSTLLAILAML